MGTHAAGDLLADRIAQFKQNKSALVDQVEVFQPKTGAVKLPILIRPKSPTWEELEIALSPIINFQGLWVTVAELYDEGFGAELLTVAEIAQERHKKDRPNNYFAKSISKASGNWLTRTLKTVHETWEVRRQALEAIERLKIDPRAYMKVLSLAWKLKSTIVRFVGLATEQGTNIKNPAGLFFKLAGAALRPAT
jgi:hypothetical protein